MVAVSLSTLGLVTPLGVGRAENLMKLLEGKRGLSTRMTLADGQTTPVGSVAELIAATPAMLRSYQSKNLSLALTALAQTEDEIQEAVAQFGVHRIGVVAASSTSGIETGVDALDVLKSSGSFPEDYDFRCQEMGSVSGSISAHYGLSGPSLTISTACSSGAKAMVSARRLIQSGLCDAVIVGAVDSLTRMTLNGFHSLGALSTELCKPFDANRRGINIGEGAAFFLMTQGAGPVMFLGAGESSDGFNMTAPHPEGKGAILAMERALEDAQLNQDQIDYVNLHGTATRLNDEMEARALNKVFTHNPYCSSSKGQIGHTLGASGAIEAAFCWLILTQDQPVLPPHIGVEQYDETIPRLNLVTQGASVARPANTIMSSSYAFGGSNISVILSRGVPC